MTPTPTAVLLITDKACSLRRLLGPVAWTVLEELHLHAQGHGDNLITVANVRALGENLALSPETVARALRTLRGRNLISVEQTRQDSGGRFGRSHYRLSPIPGLALGPSAALPHTDEPNARLPQLDPPDTATPSTTESPAAATDSLRRRHPLHHNRLLRSADPADSDQLALPGLLP